MSNSLIEVLMENTLFKERIAILALKYSLLEDIESLLYDYSQNST